MAEAVDAIIADLMVRGVDQYEANFNRASAAHGKFDKTLKALASNTFDLQQEGQKYKAGLDAIAGAEESTSAKITRTRKARTDASISGDQKETASKKRAAKEQADAGISEAERELAAKTRMANIEATLAEQASRTQRSNGRSGPLRGTGNNDGPQRPLGSNAAAFINGGDAAPEVAAAKEIDALTADIATKQAGLVALKGAEKREQQDLLSNMRLERQLRAAGVEEEEILLRLETQRAAVAAERAAQEKKQTLSGVTKFAEGAGVGRGGSGALVGGLVAASVASGVAAAAKEGLDYANNLSILSKQLGLTTKDLQVYQSAAEALGVTNEQLRTSFGQLASNIGKAQEGAKEQGKIFGKDGLAIDLGNARDGYKSLGDLLPTIIDRFSKIPDPARRAAFETALFGESGRKLDGLLSGGNASVKALGDELERTGGILSGEDIARSAKVAADLKKVGDQLERDLASTVSQNAVAIESLAKSLLDAAASMLQFITAFQRLQAQRLITSGEPGVAAAGRATLNQTPEGRSTLRQANDAQLRALRLGGRTDAPLLNIGGDVGDTDIFGAYSGLVKNTPEARAAARRQLLAQRRTIVQAEDAAKALNPGTSAGVQDGKPGNLNVFAPDPKKPRTGPKEATQEQKDDDFNAKQERLRSQLLEATAAITEAAEDRARAENARVDAEHAAFEKEIADDKKLTEARRNILRGEEAKVVAAQRDKIEQDRLHQIATEQFQLADADRAASVDLLQSRIGLAKTAKDRYELELQLLDEQNKRQIASLDHQIDVGNPQEKAAAYDALARIPAQTAAAKAALAKQNQGPIADYRDSLDDPKRQVQQAVADKLKAVDDAITDQAAKVLGVKDPFLKSLLQIFLQQNVLKPLYDAVQSASKGGGSGVSGIFQSILGAFGGSGGSSSFQGSSFLSQSDSEAALAGIIPGFATGGSGVFGGNPGIDRNVLSMNGKPFLRVGQGETFSVSPNVGASNRAVQAAAPQITVVAPQHFDLSNAVMTPDLVAQINAQTQAYSNQVGQAAYKAAVNTSGAQGPAILQRKQTLGN